VQRTYRNDVIGLVPAAGSAKRLAPLPCSKELYPIGFFPWQPGSLRPKAVCHHLLERMRAAGVTRAYVVLRNGKWDIPAYLGDGKMFDMNLAYLMMDLPYGVPYTLDQAYPFVADATVALGFPDVLFEPGDAFVQLFKRLDRSRADVVLGLWHTPNPQKMDMVEFGEDGKVVAIHTKPLETQLKYAWMVAVWAPDFTRFMHERVQAMREFYEGEGSRKEPGPRGELFLGNVIQDAIDHGMSIESVIFPGHRCLDVGTVEDLMKAIHMSSPCSGWSQDHY
jgi:glucose-1-phosphate thymidylyltransferase